MFAKLKVQALVPALLLAVVLASCTAAPTPTATPTTIPTIDPRPTFDAISTQAAQTVVADLTLNAPTATPVTPTVAPSATFTPAPTDTPAPTQTATQVFIPWTKTPTPAPLEYACTVLSVSPAASETIKVDTEFDATWSLKNTGTKAWVADSMDIKFISGTKLHQKADVVDMKSDVAPNGTYTIVMDMKSPSGDGTFTTTWGIGLPDGSTCSFGLTINVAK